MADAAPTSKDAPTRKEEEQNLRSNLATLAKKKAQLEELRQERKAQEAGLCEEQSKLMDKQELCMFLQKEVMDKQNYRLKAAKEQEKVMAEFIEEMIELVQQLKQQKKEKEAGGAAAADDGGDDTWEAKYNEFCTKALAWKDALDSQGEAKDVKDHDGFDDQTFATKLADLDEFIKLDTTWKGKYDQLETAYAKLEAKYNKDLQEFKKMTSPAFKKKEMGSATEQVARLMATERKSIEMGAVDDFKKTTEFKSIASQAIDHFKTTNEYRKFLENEATLKKALGKELRTAHEVELSQKDKVMKQMQSDYKELKGLSATQKTALTAALKKETEARQKAEQYIDSMTAIWRESGYDLGRLKGASPSPVKDDTRPQGGTKRGGGGGGGGGGKRFRH
jgi:hypothetical protein